MRPGKRHALPDTTEGRVDDLIETAKAHFRAKVEHPFRVIKRQLGFQKTRLRGMLKNRCKVKVLSALFSTCSWRDMSCHARRNWRKCCAYLGQVPPQMSGI
jgi:hypothetical protein